ncbi:MAG: peptide MFS transporter [Cellvibrionaceae bacterium]|nr:peptide MFS transporter [Cellvibrionaceae bacterium]
MALDKLTTHTEPNKGFFGHPAGLQTLFFTEMWERMSYYGMRALLVLFMTTAINEGGLAMGVATATAIYGLYTGSVYFLGLPGGWISDRIIGSQKAVWYGGWVIFSGHVVLAIPNEKLFFVGLMLVAIGTGLLKPNITALVGQLYGKQDPRRDGGFTIYYMGINIGSIIGYTVTGLLAEKVGWHWGFGAAAIGMALGLIQYKRSIGNLEGIGEKAISPVDAKQDKNTLIGLSAAGLAVFSFVLLSIFGVVSVDPVEISQYVVVTITALFFLFFAYLFFLCELNPAEKKSMLALLFICVASACFWAGFEQAGSSLNLFGRDFTNRVIGDFVVPTAWFQNANPLFIVTLSPFFAALWINLGKRMLDPSYTVKCAIGLVIMGSGFLVMFFAAQLAASGMKVAPYWLITTYFLHTVGELCLSPVALSAVTRLAPARLAGQSMGLFVLTYAIGNVIAGLFAGQFDPENLQELPGLFLQISAFTAVVAVFIFVVSFITKHWEKSI